MITRSTKPNLGFGTNSATSHGLFLFGLLTTLAILLLLSQIVTSSLLSWGALFYYIALCLFVIKYHPSAFVLLLWFSFVRLTTMISGVAIESGGYMPEMLTTGYPSGAFVRLAAVYTAGILGGVFLLEMIMRHMPDIKRYDRHNSSLWVYPVFAIVLLCCGWALLIGLKHGFPALEGIDRMLYWKQVSSRFLYFFLGNRSIFCLFLGLIYAVTSGGKKKSALMISILILVISLLFAEKFTSICVMIFSFITPVFLRDRTLLTKLTSRLIPLGALIAIITLPAILLAYGVFDDKESSIQRLRTRATSQAEIWFMADKTQDDIFQVDFLRLAHNTKAITSRDPLRYVRSAPYLGAKDFMVTHMDEERYAHYAERSVSLTLATEGYLLKIFGHAGMIPAYLLLTGVYCAYLSYLFYAIMIASPFRLLMIAKLLVWANYGLNQGYFYSIIGFKPFILIGMMISFEIITRTIQKISMAKTI